MTAKAEPGWVPPPGWNGFPVADARCRTCRHDKRELIEALLDAGMSAPAVVRYLADQGIWTPGEDSVRNHHRRHRHADPQAIRRAQGQLRLAEFDRRARRARPGLNIADLLLMPPESAPDSVPTRPASPADQRLVTG